jgi:hypothetical protein
MDCGLKLTDFTPAEYQALKEETVKANERCAGM